LHFGLGNAVMAAAMALVAALAGRVSRRPAVVHGLWLLVLIKLVTPSFLPVSIQKLLLPGEKADQPLGLDALAVSPAFEANIPSAGAQSIKAPIIEAANEPPAAVLLSLPLPQPEVKLEQAQPGAAAPSPEAEPSPQARVISWTALGGGLWLTGSVLWFSLAATRLYRFRQLLRRAEPGPAQLQARVRRLAG